MRATFPGQTPDSRLRAGVGLMGDRTTPPRNNSQRDYPASPSAREGLREGDVILELDRKPVKSAEDAVKLSDQVKGPKVMVLVWREGQSRFVVVDESTG